MTAWFWITKRLWQKIELYDSLESLCNKLNVGNDVRRRFPHLVHHVEATNQGVPPPLAFGTPLERLCVDMGGDFIDRTTGRRYPNMPSALICLCEALERHDADRQFSILFTGSASNVYDCVGRLDEGLPLDPETPLEVLWCTLKLFLDCLPAPLLSFDAFTALKTQSIDVCDQAAQRALLLEFLHKWLPSDVSYITLYLASFFHTMCKCSEERALNKNQKALRELSHGDDDNDDAPTVRSMRTDRNNLPILTPDLVAQGFTPSFLRPRQPTEECMQYSQVAVAVVKQLVIAAEDPSFWIGKAPSATRAYWDFVADGNAAADTDDDSDDYH
jgi:hypothetical protein